MQQPWQITGKIIIKKGLARHNSGKALFVLKNGILTHFNIFKQAKYIKKLAFSLAPVASSSLQTARKFAIVVVLVSFCIITFITFRKMWVLLNCFAFSQNEHFAKCNGAVTTSFFLLAFRCRSHCSLKAFKWIKSFSGAKL